MRCLIGGVRGSFPVAQPAFMKYGGETTAFLVESSGGDRVLVDAGTGVRVLGERLANAPGDRRLLLLMTHFHLDHLIGLPALCLLYDEGWSLQVAAPARDDSELQDTLSAIMEEPYWPLQLSDAGASLAYRALPLSSDSPLEWGGLRIRWCPLHHPGGCTAYRIDEPAAGTSVVIATDVEWGLSSESEREALIRLCRIPVPADILFFDGQFTPEEIERYRGWGHSTWREAVEVASAAQVPAVRLIHHDPRKTDDVLDALGAQLPSGGGRAPSFARGGECLELKSLARLDPAG